MEHYSHIKHNDKILEIKLQWNSIASLAIKINCLGNKTAMERYSHIKHDKYLGNKAAVEH